MKSREGSVEAGKAAVTVIAIILVAFILFVLVMTPAQREKLIPGYPDKSGVSEYYKDLLSDISPVSLQAGNESELAADVTLENVKIDGLPKEASEQLASRASVERSWIFTHRDWSGNFETNENLVSARLSFNVVEKKRDGLLLVYLNGKQVFSEKADRGQNIKVDLPVDRINPNGSTIRIDVSAGFFGNGYDVTDVYLVKNEFDPKAAKAEQEFEMDDKVLAGLQSAELSMSINTIKDAVSKPLTIAINNKSVYSATPKKAGELIVEDLPIDVFVEETNTVSFSTGVHGGYDLTNVGIDMIYLNVSDIAPYDISVDEEDWKRVKSPNYECILYIKRASGDRSIWITLNDKSLRYSFVDSVIEQNVCKFLKEGDNSLSLRADTTGGAKGQIDVENVNMYIQKKVIEEE